MRRLFIDTNIVLDLLLNREPWASHCKKIMIAQENGEIELFISPITLNNIHYVIQKEAKRMGSSNPREQARVALKFCLDYFEVTSLHARATLDAFLLNGLDFEDDLQIVSAIAAACVCIVTRDQKGFRQCPVEVVGPWEMAARLA